MSMTPFRLTEAKPQTGSRLYWLGVDAFVLTKRSLTHMVRNMDQLLSVAIMPIMFLLLFRYVFGGAINTGGTSYVNFLVAGIVVQTLAFGASTTAINVIVDLKRGIVDRFRSLPMTSAALLLAHVTADLVRNFLSCSIMMLFGMLIGFRPTATLTEWLMIFGLLLLFTFALSWLFAIVGLLVKSMEGAQWATFVVIMPLTFASSAFVPTDTMPTALRVFAENQPFTLVIEAMRAWMVGTPVGNAAWISLIWCVVIIVLAVPTAVWVFEKRKTVI